MNRILISAFLLSCTVGILFSACQPSDDETSNAKGDLRFTLEFDAEQPRLNNIGQAAVIPAGNAAQTPVFRKMSVHYIELAPSALTLLGQGAIVYKGAETNKGGENAVDFDEATLAADGELFTKISLKDVPPGTYEWVRTSVTYQNYDVVFNLKNILSFGDLDQQHGTIASFVGFNTYLSDLSPRSGTLQVNDDKKQGFWAFETDFSAPLDSYNSIFSGEAPAGATTVVNPLFATSPIPPGSCVVTGKFAEPLVITGNETGDVTVKLSFSVNQSFEWKDVNGNGQLDLYADDPANNEKVTDMGLRGVIPSF